nr:CoA-transferase [Paenibacillus sp. RC343]
MNNKVISAEEAVKKVKDGDTVMVGGFLAGGFPEDLVRALVDTNSAGNLTIISNDTGTPELSIYNLVKSGRVKRIFCILYRLQSGNGQAPYDERSRGSALPARHAR